MNNKEFTGKVLNLLSKAPDLKNFMQYANSTTKTNALDAKTKELISLAVGIYAQCDDCINWHVEAAIKAGAAEEEIIDTLKIAVAMGGGPGLAHAVKAYDYYKAHMKS